MHRCSEKGERLEDETARDKSSEPPRGINRESNQRIESRVFKIGRVSDMQSLDDKIARL